MGFIKRAKYTQKVGQLTKKTIPKHFLNYPKKNYEKVKRVTFLRRFSQITLREVEGNVCGKSSIFHVIYQNLDLK